MGGYKKTFKKRISVSYSGSVRYPASEHGGTQHYSGTTYEDVWVNIEVDTDPLERSIDECNQSVSELTDAVNNTKKAVGGTTAAVVAAESAEIVSIRKNSRKVGSTIINGFFKTIRSEISQQIMELQSRIDADLTHLNQLSQRCIEKKKQMELDYRRTSERYTKIFVDLNNELEHRIYELDKPTFQFKNLCVAEGSRSIGNDILSTIAITGKENSDAQAKISTSITKQRAFNAIMQANTYLSKQKQTERTINKSMLSDNVSQRIFIPICFIESNNKDSQIDRSVYKQKGTLNESQVNQTMSNFENQQWSDAVPNNDAEIIKKYFNTEIGNAYSANDAHSIRVKENIAKLLDFNKIKTNIK